MVFKGFFRSNDTIHCVLFPFIYSTNQLKTPKPTIDSGKSDIACLISDPVKWQEYVI